MIEIKNISKAYSNISALKNVNLNFKRGSFTLIVGPNASGKSTLLKSILSLINYSGNIYIDSTNIFQNEMYKQKIGYMPQNFSFPDNLTVGELFDFIQSLRNRNFEDVELLETYDIRKLFNQKIKNLSGGTKQKVSASIAFLFNPSILILDEPTAGLDPAACKILKEKLLQENDRGKTILITSHVVSDFESIATDVILLIDAELKYHGKIETLLNNTNTKNLESALALCINGNL